MDHGHVRKIMISECLRDAYLTQKVEKQTRHRVNQTSNVLDFILVSEDNLISKIGYLDPTGKNDHGVLVFQLYVANNKNQKRRYKYDMNKGDFNQMTQLFNDVSWESMTHMDVDKFWNCLKKLIHLNMDSYIPRVIVRKKRNVNPFG